MTYARCTKEEQAGQAINGRHDETRDLVHERCGDADEGDNDAECATESAEGDESAVIIVRRSLMDENDGQRECNSTEDDLEAAQAKLNNLHYAGVCVLRFALGRTKKKKGS